MALNGSLSTIYVSETIEFKQGASLKPSENKLSDAQHRVQEIKLTNVTVHQLAAEADEAETAPATFQRYVQSLENRAVEMCN